MTQTLNLDALNPEKKLVTLGGKTFDVTRMPVAIFAELQKKALAKALNIQGYLELISDWFTQIDPSITPEWIKEQLNDAKIIRTVQHNLFDKVLLDPLEEFVSDLPEEPETKKKSSIS